MKRIVIIGAGLAGLRATEELRRLGFDGAITLVGAERTGPYDRPPLSKEVLTGQKDPQETLFRTADRYAELAVDLRLGQPASTLDVRRRTVRAGGRDLAFDGLIIATGSAARELSVRGEPCTGVHLVRTLDDARSLRGSMLRSRHVVVIGAGFIGSEVASSARALGLDVTVIEAAPVPLTRVVGSEIGEICASLHRENGTRLICDAQISAIVGDESIRRIELTDGRLVEGDLVVAGVGASPEAGWLAGGCLTVADGVVCDPYLNAGPAAVYAAGDVARWHNPLFDRVMRVEQWTNASEQGRRAAANLLAGPGNGKPYAGANYFWSDQYGVRIQFAGIADADEVRIVHGASANFRFLAFYRKADRLVGAFAMGLPEPLIRSKLLIERAVSWDRALALVKEGALLS